MDLFELEARGFDDSRQMKKVSDLTGFALFSEAASCVPDDYGFEIRPVGGFLTKFRAPNSYDFYSSMRRKNTKGVKLPL